MYAGAGPRRSAGQLRADHLMVVADPAGGDDHRRRAKFERVDLARASDAARVSSVGSSTAPRTPDDRAAVDDQLVDPMAEREADQAALFGGEDRLGEDPHDLRAGAPGRCGNAGPSCRDQRAAVAALGPADERHDLQAEGVEVVALLGGGEADVRLGPLPRPVVVVSVGRTPPSRASPAAPAHRSP